MQQQKLRLTRRLVDIVEDFRQLLITIGDNDGEVEEGLLKELAESEEAFESKVENCLLMVEEFKYQAEAYKKRAKALSDHSKAMANRAERLRNLVRDGMVQLNIHKMRTPSFPTVYLKKAQSLNIVDPHHIIDLLDDDESVVQYVEPKINKSALKNRLKDSEIQERIGKAVDWIESISLIVR